MSFQGDIDFEFVGRTYDFNEIDKAWLSNKYRIFGIYGLRAVGKSRFVFEYLGRKEVLVLHIDLKTVTNVNHLYTGICALLKIEPYPDRIASTIWISHIVEELVKIHEETHVAIVFDNGENAFEGQYRDDLLSLCIRIARNCSKVKVVITSTTRVQFSQLAKTYWPYELKPLRHSEAKQLLENVAPNVTLSSFGDAIVDLSEGLPLLILMIGAELQDNDQLITPEHMVTLLLNSRLETLSSECYPEEERIGSVYMKFVMRLSGVYRDYLTTLDYIPGSFNAQEAAEILDCETVATAKQFSIKPIRIRHMLNYDTSSERFNIQGIIREVIKANITIKDLAGVRARYCRTFTSVMKEISKQMSTADYTKAMSEFAVEQPNLRKLLGEVHHEHTNEESYNFYIEMVSSCTELIEVYLASDGETFYDGCLSLAEKYGRTRDKAVVFMAVGSMETYTKGDLLCGARNYHLALKEIECKGKSLQLATLYQKMGWNIFKQGDSTKAIEYYNKSLSISQGGGTEYESLSLQSLSYTGVAHVVLGNFDTAEKYHTYCLRRSEKQKGKIHPKVGDAINRIGLLYDQKGDSVTALELFKQSLNVKRQSNAAPIAIVYSLSNVANGNNNVGNYAEAHRLVDEAFDILEKQKINMLDGISLMYNTRGKIFAKKCKWKEASVAFNKTVEITRQIEQKSYVYMKRLVNLAEVLERRSHYKSCLDIAKEAMEIKEEAIKTLPHNFIVTECLQCMARVYDCTGHRKQYLEMLYQIEAECYRLERVCTAQYNKTKLESINKTLIEVHQQLHRLIL